MQLCCKYDFISLVLHPFVSSMVFFYNVILFLVTFLGGSAPLWSRGWTEQRMKYLLAFSGSFLLGITFLHLVPETIAHLGNAAGILLLAGFFGQQFVQRFTHGVEHGHAHIVTGEKHRHTQYVAIWPLFTGLAIHAFSEGLPLGVSYTEPTVLPSLFLAIALHKLPEAMLIISLFYHQNKSKIHSVIILCLFSLITPFSSLFSYIIGAEFAMAELIIQWCLPLIAGAFIHIAATIFFESGTKAHEMNGRKWLSILSGIGFALLTLLGSHVH